MKLFKVTFSRVVNPDGTRLSTCLMACSAKQARLKADREFSLSCGPVFKVECVKFSNARELDTHVLAH